MIKDHICSASPLSLGEMVDLQAALERDADEDEQILIDRDVAIGRQIGAADQPDVDAVRGWLQQVQAGDKPAFGRALERRGLTLAWLIRTGAFFAGGLTVAGWLEVQGRQPINVINFWAAVIGTQLVFLIFLAYSTARWRWAARYARAGGASDSRALPLMAGAVDRLWTRVVKPGEARGVPSATWAKVRRLYGEPMGWAALRWAQLLAVFYNLGAVAALVLWSTVSDPAFGWRSTLLDDRTVNLWAQRIALPWSWTGWGLPSAETISATRYSSLEARFVESGLAPDALGGATHLWAAWWPFLLMSLLVFGLAPRLATYAWTSWKLSHAIKAAPWRSAAAEQLLHRLRRASVSSTADRRPSEGAAIAEGRAQQAARGASAANAPVFVLKWCGVPVNDGDVAPLITSTLPQAVAGPVYTIGGKDLLADEVAVAKVAGAEGKPGVAVLVEGWHPPVGDYVDVFEQLRRSMKAGRGIDVLICGLTPTGQVAAPSEPQLRLWRKRLLALGDPWLSVHPVRVGGLR